MKEREITYSLFNVYKQSGQIQCSACYYNYCTVHDSC